MTYSLYATYHDENPEKTFTIFQSEVSFCFYITDIFEVNGEEFYIEKKRWKISKYPFECHLTLKKFEPEAINEFNE